MKAKILFQRLVSIFLMIVIVGNPLAIPSQTVLAKPLAGPFTDCASQTEIPALECDALVVLYNTTDGPNWYPNNGWLQTDAPCDWDGVDCEEGTNVTSLSFNNHLLNGPIPPELSNLSELQSLDLSSNDLTGSIPMALGSLENLMFLDLGGNQLTGSIPSQLGNLQDLIDMGLQANDLNGSIPPQLGNLTNLTGLSLWGNQLTGTIPAEIGDLTQLEYLYLENNQLSGEFPTSITNLTSLYDFAFDECDGLTSSNPGVIAFIDNLVGPGWQCKPIITNVNPDYGSPLGGTSVTISGQDFTGASAVTFGGVSVSFTVDDDSQITVISPAHAQGTVDITITNSYGDGTGIDAFTYNLPFTNCASVSQIPESECDALLALYTSTDGENWYSNTGWQETDTPCSWDGVSCDAGTNVTDLDLGGNNLTGNLPAALGDLSQLQNLRLNCNDLYNIPAELGQLSQLQTLYLYCNQIDGPIPAELGDLANLTVLDLHSNFLSGQIPTHLGDLSALTRLDLSYNIQLNGGIPTEFGSMTQLNTLYLDGTQLAGEIPTSFTNLTALTDLALSCGLTSTNQNVIDFIDLILGSGWDDECPIAPANDDFGDAFVINPLPYTDTQDTTDATTAVNDPSLVCGPTDPGTNSVWYTYTPASAGTLTLDTFGSNYDTILSVWTGSPGSLEDEGCNDDSGGVQSELSIHLTAGEIYFIEVAGYYDFGDLVFNADFVADILPTPTKTLTPTLTRTPTPTLTPSPTATATPIVQTFTSTGAQDGWILESSETSKKGGKLNSKTTTFNLGDDAAKKQYLGILSFSTGAALPDNANITAITLKVKKSGISGGGNPVTTFQGFTVEVKEGFFGAAALQTSDFQARADKSYGPFKPAPVSNWYSIDLIAAKDYINTSSSSSGLTQIRLRFKLDDNNNAVANILKLFSGNAPATSRPQLIITYLP